VVLGKDPLIIKDTQYILIEIILYLAHGNRKVIILFNYGADEDLISQHFAKENGLEVTPVGYMEITVDGYYITIYKSYNIITKIKDSRNEVRVT